MALSHSRGSVFRSGLGQNAPMMELSFRVPWTPLASFLSQLTFAM